MATPRTDQDWVKALLKRNYDGTTDLDPFIRGASILVDRVVSCASKKNDPLTDDESKEIEGYIAAHLYAHQDQLYKTKSTQGASASFQTTPGGVALESTDYGQTALMLDHSGCLNALSRRQRAGAFWLGKVASEQTNIQDAKDD